MAQTELKWTRRDKRRNKKKHGMRVSGKSVFIIKHAQAERDKKITGGK